MRLSQYNSLNKDFCSVLLFLSFCIINQSKLCRIQLEANAQLLNLGLMYGISFLLFSNKGTFSTVS